MEKRGKKSGKNWEKEEKSGRESKNREVSFTLPLLTDRLAMLLEKGYFFLKYVNPQTIQSLLGNAPKQEMLQYMGIVVIIA